MIRESNYSPQRRRRRLWRRERKDKEKKFAVFAFFALQFQKAGIVTRVKGKLAPFWGWGLLGALSILLLLPGFAAPGAAAVYARASYQTIPTRTPTPLPTATGQPQPTPPPGGDNTPAPAPTVAVTPEATATAFELAPTPEGGYWPTAEPCAPPTAQSVSSLVNVRLGPGQDYEIVTQMVYFEVHPIVGRSAHAPWWQIQLPDGTLGWVANVAVVVHGNSAFAPLVDSPPIAGSTPTPGPLWNPTPNPLCPPVPTATAAPTDAPATVTSAPPTATTTAAALAAAAATMTPTPTSAPPTALPSLTTAAVPVVATATAPPTAIPLVEPDSAGGGSSWLLYGGAVLILAGILTFILRARRG